MEVFVYSLLTGLLLSTLLGAVVLVSLFSNPEIWVDDYPPDIRARFGPIGNKSRRLRRWTAVVFFLVPISMLVFSLPGLVDAAVDRLSFWQLFAHSFIALEVFNLIDLLILDWLIFVRIQPARIILPGTQGLDGYKNYAFHFRGFLLGHIFIFLFSLLFASLVSRFV